MIKLSSRRNPVKNNLKEYENYEFDHFKILDKNRKRQIMSYLPLIACDKFYYVAPFDAEAWTKIRWEGIDKDKLFRELSLSDRPLLQQAEKNGLELQFFYGDDLHGRENRIRNIYRRVPQVLKILYGEQE